MAAGLTFIRGCPVALCILEAKLSITGPPGPTYSFFSIRMIMKHLAKSKIITNFKSTKQNAIQYKNIENLRKQGDL